MIYRLVTYHRQRREKEAEAWSELKGKNPIDGAHYVHQGLAVKPDSCAKPSCVFAVVPCYY
jgi:hypothetical protein